MVPYSSPRIYIDWYTRVVQYNKIGIVEKPKNRRNMGWYTSPKIRLIRIKTGLLEETKNEVGPVDQPKNIGNI